MTVANADSYHAEYAVFAGPTYASLLAAGLTASLVAWTAPTTGKPTGWTDITDRTYWPGGLRTSLNGNSITWEAELQGANYDTDYLDIGLAVVLWRRYYTPAGGWEAWAREYVGQIVSTDDQNDYRDGKPWRRTLTGTNYNLTRLNAPPLAVGPLDVTTGSTVDVWNGDVLPDAALEAGSGEYIGEVATLGGGNIADGRLTTVFISNTAPNTVEDVQAGGQDGYVMVSEVMFQPANGWPQSACWWIEVYSTRDREQPQEFHLVSGRDYNPATEQYDTLAYIGAKDYLGVHGWGDKYTLEDGRFGVICGNRALFELYSGGAPDAQFVIDASLYNPLFTLSPTDGFVTVTNSTHTAGDPKKTIIWTPGGVARKADNPNSADGDWWYGPSPVYAPATTFDSSTLPANGGYSVRRQIDYRPGDGVMGSASDFTAVRFPTPGGHTTKATPVVLKVQLPPNVCHLTMTVDAGTTGITLDNYVGWFEDGGKGIVESDIFSFTSRTTAGLQGVTWDAPGDHSHQAGARALPYAQVYWNGSLTWSQQEGYPLSDFFLLRRRAPAIKEGRIYFSFLPNARQYEDETGWFDYSWQFSWANNAELSRRFTLADPVGGTPFLWVGTVLIVIDAMADGGRAKLNEIWARAVHLQHAPVDTGASAPTFTQTANRSGDLANYLLTTYCGFAAADFVDSSYVYTHRLGAHRLSLASLAKILNDLARQTGCLVYYNPDGKIYWLDDPWWPYRAAFTRAQAWTNATLVGDIRVAEQAQTIDYVVVNAISLDSEPPHPIRVTYPPPPGGNLEPPAGYQAVEINGLSVISETDARLLAEMEWLKARATANTVIALNGIYDVRPGQVVSITNDYGQGALVAWDWQITDVTLRRSQNAGGRAVTQSVGLRLWEKGRVVV